jgi:hypothetical protein
LFLSEDKNSENELKINFEMKMKMNRMDIIQNELKNEIRTVGVMRYEERL